MTEQYHNFDDERVPIPADHSPRKDTIQQAGEDLLVYEVDNPEASIFCDGGLVEVKR